MPRNGLGMPIVSGASNAPVTVIDDVLWEDFGGSGGEIAVNYQETRTNVVLYSQDATDAEAWTKGNTAIESTLYEAPDNSTTANAIKSNSTGEKVYNINQNLSVTAGKTYTLSAHVKKENLGFVQLRFSDDDGLPRAQFNLTTGAITNASNTIRTQVDSMDDGWFRCSITFVATTSSGSAMVMAQSAAGDATPNIAVSGIVLIYVWGFQLEESIEATSYIVTTTEARTRTTTLNDTSDVWDFDSANLMPEADPDSEGVWEIPANLVLNGDYEELGSELVTNGTFATETDWTFANVGFSVGAIAFDDANDNVFQSLADTVGETYELTITKTGTGVFRLRTGFAGSDATKVNIPESGVLYFTATSNTNRVQIYGDASDASLTLNSVSVKQVDPNDRWQLQYTGTGDWSITDKLNFENVNGGSAQLNVFEIGATYEITVDYVFTSGTRLILPYDGSNFPTGGVITTTGSVNSYTYYYTPNSTTLLIYSDGNGNGSVDNIIIKEYAIQPKDI